MVKTRMLQIPEIIDVDAVAVEKRRHCRNSDRSYDTATTKTNNQKFARIISDGGFWLVMSLFIITIVVVTMSTMIPSLSSSIQQPQQAVVVPQQQKQIDCISVSHRQQQQWRHSVPIEQQEEGRRRASVVVKKQRLLAVRVSSVSSGETPEESLAVIQAAIFGYNNSSSSNSKIIDPKFINATNVVEQYKLISHGQLLFEPVSTATTNTTTFNPDITFENGVVDLYIPNITFAGQSISNVTDRILQQTQNLLLFFPSSSSSTLLLRLEDIADHIVFCLPNGSLFYDGDPNWTAYTYINQPYSLYQLSRCTRLSVVVHEIGHSLGFQHSGVGISSPYADKTGYMGFATNQIGYPRKAFNGHKHWISGWFRDRSVVINPHNGPTQTRVISFVHYSDSYDQMLDDDVVLIRIGSLYIQYNRAKQYNIDADMPNTVTVTHASADDDVSDRLAALSAGDIFEYEYPFTTTKNAQNRILIIQVCSAVQYGPSQMDYAVIRTYFTDDDGIGNNEDISNCSKELFAQTQPATSLVDFPTVSPVATTTTSGNNMEPAGPIVDREESDDILPTSSNINSSDISSTGYVDKSNDDDGYFIGMIYVIVPSIVGLILFVGIAYYSYTNHCIKEHQRQDKALQNKYLPKKESSNKHRNTNNHQKQRLPDIEDLSETAEEEEEDDDNDELYVMYDAHMLEI